MVSHGFLKALKFGFIAVSPLIISLKKLAILAFLDDYIEKYKTNSLVLLIHIFL